MKIAACIGGVALLSFLLTGCQGLGATHNTHATADHAVPPQVRYQVTDVGGIKIFSREAGDPSRLAVVLLHGFPSSSHMYREVLAALGDDYFVIAPDYPGFGDSDYPDPEQFEYTFDGLAAVTNAFLEQRGIDRYVLMIQDYGAPIGYRIATAHPERVRGFVVMNGNAYEEGLGEAGWGPIFEYWKQRTPELEHQIAENVFGLEGLRWQYTHGTRNPGAILPDNWNLDFMKLSRPRQHRVQLDLFYDYRNNVALYPQWQAYLRQHQPPMLIVWGKNDAFFPAPGAQAYLRDVPDAELHLLDTGHFALEEDAPFIIDKMRGFLGSLADTPQD
ncbi:MAG: alpha/beta hydrolase [Planctomycetota bacterium]